jgi:hypothetical protein
MPFGQNVIRFHEQLIYSGSALPGGNLDLQQYTGDIFQAAI